MMSAKISDFLTPSPPCPQIHATSLTELPSFVCFSTNPPPPLGADVINGSPLVYVACSLEGGEEGEMDGQKEGDQSSE